MIARKSLPVLVIFVLVALTLAGCATPTPQKVEVTRVVEVTRLVEKPAAATTAPAAPAATATPVAKAAATTAPVATTAAGATARPPRPTPLAGQKRLDFVKARGKVVCGVHTSLPGFGYLDKDGKNAGFDVDFCRAVAAAIFNNRDAVEFVPISAAERGPALQTGEIDILARNTTWTTTRDAQWGNFVAILFYDGQGMMVRKSTGFTKLEDLNGATVCVTSGTTTELNLADAFRQRNLKYTAVTFEDTPSVYNAYEQGRCDAVTSDKSQLAATRSGFKAPADHIIMDITFSKEPLGPAVPQGDDQWFDVVKMVAFTLLNAEELGVSSANVNDMLKSADPSIKRMLGAEGSFGQTDIGLAKDFAVNVIRTVGNYGEIYDRYMGPKGVSFTLDRGLNKLWTQGGVMYAPPLR